MDDRTESLSRIVAGIGALTRDFAASGVYPFRSRGLGRSSMNLLFALSQSEGISVARLAEQLQVTSGAVSQTVDALREAGLVTSDVNPVDRRARILRLTPEARVEVDQFQRDYFEGIAPRFASLSLEEIVELDRILAALIDRRDDDG